MDNKKESDEKEISGFRCKICGEIIDLGLCGDHRFETLHDEFEAIYKN
jgi:hypothetical protein